MQRDMCRLAFLCTLRFNPRCCCVRAAGGSLSTSGCCLRCTAVCVMYPTQRCTGRGCMPHQQFCPALGACFLECGHAFAMNAHTSDIETLSFGPRTEARNKLTNLASTRTPRTALAGLRTDHHNEVLVRSNPRCRAPKVRESGCRVLNQRCILVMTSPCHQHCNIHPSRPSVCVMGCSGQSPADEHMRRAVCRVWCARTSLFWHAQTLQAIP
jgi:hypothetical protein